MTGEMAQIKRRFSFFFFIMLVMIVFISGEKKLIRGDILLLVFGWEGLSALDIDIPA